jgi:hypothetical protein
MQSTLTQQSESIDGTLADLSAAINREHELCCCAAGQALDHAMKCGDLLAQAKADCEHGQWQQWLTDNFSSSARTARLYMQLAEHRESIEAKRQSVTVLTIPEARRLIVEPGSTEPHAERATANAATLKFAGDCAKAVNLATLEELQTIHAKATREMQAWEDYQLRCELQLKLLLQEKRMLDGMRNTVAAHEALEEIATIEKRPLAEVFDRYKQKWRGTFDEWCQMVRDFRATLKWRASQKLKPE